MFQRTRRSLNASKGVYESVIGRILLLDMQVGLYKALRGGMLLEKKGELIREGSIWISDSE